MTFTGGTIVDQNGDDIDPTITMGPNGNNNPGFGGGKGEQTRPSFPNGNGQTTPTLPDDSTVTSGATTNS